MCTQIKFYSMCLNCLLLASTRASSRAHSVSMDAPVTRYSMGAWTIRIAWTIRTMTGRFVPRCETDKTPVRWMNVSYRNMPVCKLCRLSDQSFCCVFIGAAIGFLCYRPPAAHLLLQPSARCEPTDTLTDTPTNERTNKQTRRIAIPAGGCNSWR